jgi:REP element-mobilizing transposase RayT
MDALVLLDDHLHAIWSLPEGDTDYSMRWGWIKKEFTKAWLLAGGGEQPLSLSRLNQGGTVFGSAAFGSTRYVTSRIMTVISTISITIPSSTAMLSVFVTGLIQRFIAG